MDSMIDTLDRCIARLALIKQQMDCEHDYTETPGVVACKRCLASIEVCLVCDMPTYDGECTWCNK